MTLFRPVPVAELDRQDHLIRLAGGWCWFDPTGVPDVELARLTAPRVPIAGLSLERPRIMGILNITPDSFSDGGDLATVAQAVARAKAVVGVADIIDIGGESTRPGAAPVPVSVEIARVVPVIAAIRAAGITLPISVDTRKAQVAAAALRAGASMVNDVSALQFDPDMAAVVAAADVPVCLMHALGDPATMQDDPHYGDVVAEVYQFLQDRLDMAVTAGIGRHRIIVDPGIGFGKTLQHNVTLLRHLDVLHGLGQPILLGVSRKRFIGQIGGQIGGVSGARDRLAGSLAVALHAVAQGVQILRVHDTTETRQALSLHQAVTG